MRYFIDTEFLEQGPYHPIKLISIGMVSEEGKEYYAECSEFLHSEATPWLKENVIPHLNGPRKSRAEIRSDILKFAPASSLPEFWGWFSAYDWVVFAQIFGSMLDLPRGYPYFCRDLKQLVDDVKVPTLPKQEGQLHNALADAKWNLQLFKYLLSL